MESHVITLDGKKIDLENEIEEIELDEEDTLTGAMPPPKVLTSPRMKERSPVKRKAVARKRVTVSSLKTFEQNSSLVTRKIDDSTRLLDFEVEEDDGWKSPDKFPERNGEPPDEINMEIFNRLHSEPNTPPRSSESGRRASTGATGPPKATLPSSPGAQRRKSLGDTTPPASPDSLSDLDLTELYSRLQVLLPKGDATKGLWPRVLILQRAKSFIRALRKGDLELELATEVLMQENFRLQYRVRSLKRRSSTETPAMLLEDSSSLT